MLIRNSVLFFITILVFGCVSNQSNNGNKELIHVPIESNLDNNRQVYLSQLASNIEYIPLETKEGCYLDRIRDIILTEHYIFAQTRKAVVQFTRKGKFLRKVGKNGKGPGEFGFVYHLAVNDDLQRIYINDGGRKKLVCYDFDGNFIEEFPVPDYPGLAFDWIDKESFLLNVRNPQGDTRIKSISFSTKTDSLKGFANFERFPVHGNGAFWMVPDRFFYHYQNGLHFRKLYGDTIFACTSPHELKPVYKLQLGDKFLPLEKRIEYVEDMERYQSYAGRYLNPIVYESEDWLFLTLLQFDYKGSVKTGLYNKRSQEFCSVRDSKGEYGLVNDFDGGLHFWPERVYNDTLLCSWSSAEAFKSDFEDEKFKWNEAKSKVKQEQLKNLLGKIKVEDNPIVIVATLKSDS